MCGNTVWFFTSITVNNIFQYLQYINGSSGNSYPLCAFVLFHLSDEKKIMAFQMRLVQEFLLQFSTGDLS